MKRNSLVTVLILIVFAFTACRDNEEKASIVGKWEGERSEIQFTPTGSPIPVYSESDEDFNATLEFNEGGTVTLVSGTQTSTGTYQVQDNKLMTTLSLNIEFTDLTGTFTIKKLTQSSLELFLEDEREVTIPDVGDFSGKIKATFSFSRINN